MQYLRCLVGSAVSDDVWRLPVRCWWPSFLLCCAWRAWSPSVMQLSKPPSTMNIHPYASSIRCGLVANSALGICSRRESLFSTNRYPTLPGLNNGSGLRGQHCDRKSSSFSAEVMRCERCCLRDRQEAQLFLFSESQKQHPQTERSSRWSATRLLGKLLNCTFYFQGCQQR